MGSADDFDGPRKALLTESSAGRPLTIPTALSLLVFFVFALQCTSTIAIMARETGTWRRPAFAFLYMLTLAWTEASSRSKWRDSQNKRAGDRGRTGDVQLGKLIDEGPEDYQPWG